jgi:hypothetical protein
MAILGLAIFMIVSSLFLSCATPPSTYRSYEGAELPSGQAAVFQFVAPFFISIVPYKLDGRPHLYDGDTRFMEGTFYSFKTTTSDWAFAPGRHSVEFYTVDTDPLKQIIVSLDMEAGKTYVMKGTSKEFDITCDGKSVPFEVSPVPILEEPSEDQPHAILSFIPQKSAIASVPYLFRIDGKVRTTMYKLHPRWTCMNYSSLARGIVTSVGGAGMLLQPNLDVKEGYISIRLEPGTHQIEYFADGTFLGQRAFGTWVRTIDFTAEAGRSYAIEIVPDDAPLYEGGLTENGIRIVAE